jgi:DNA modification methylase
MTTDVRFEVRTADWLDALRAMPAGSADCIVTSPPY